MDSDERDEILRTLLRIAVSQEAINTDLRTCVQELRDFNAQQVLINERLETLGGGTPGAAPPAGAASAY